MKRLFVLAAIGALAACSQSDEPQGESAEDFAQRAGVNAPGGQVPSVAEINAQPVVAPTGAAQLTPLASDAPKALGKIQGGCSFIYQGRSLLVVGAGASARARYSPSRSPRWIIPAVTAPDSCEKTGKEKNLSLSGSMPLVTYAT